MNRTTAPRRKRRHDKVCSSCGQDDLPYAVSGAQSAASSRSPKEITIGELAAEYIETHLKRHSSERTWQDSQRAIKNYFGPLIDQRACELKKREVKLWHLQLGETHGKTTANRAVQLLRALINSAIDSELLPEGTANPCQRIKLFKLQSRDRYLSRDEIARLLAAIENLRYETTRHFLLMCLYTGQRRSNVMAMAFEEIDFDRAVWRIPKTKNGESHLVPLIEPALDLLKQRLEQSAGRQHVFSSERSPSGHMTRPENAWGVVREAAGIPDARIHDMRRNMGSWAAIEGTSMAVLMKLLGHKDASSTMVYARLDLEPVRAAMSKAIAAMGAGKITEIAACP